MKRLFITTALIIGSTFSAQVGINTENPEAKLDIRATNHLGAVTAGDGILVPRVNSLGNSGKVNGQLVYLVANAGTFHKGFHFWDGTAWRRLIADPQPKETWQHEANHTRIKLATKSDRVTSRPTGTEMVVTDNGKLGIGTLAPNAKLDIRRTPTSTSNPGEGFMGLGTTSASASSAGAGALRYTTSTGGKLQYSNGSTWNTLGSTPQKSIVVAKKISPQTFQNKVHTNVTGWVTETDLNNNFIPSQGIFIAPRDGNYVVSFSYTFNSADYVDSSTIEAQLHLSDGTYRKSINGFAKAGTALSGATLSFTIKMFAGETVRPMIYQSTGSPKSFRVADGIASRDGFVNFSVAEL